GARVRGAGYVAIRRRRVHVHRACMAAAFATSVVFLASYLTYHLQAGTTRFPGQGWVRPFYFSLLGTHTVLAASIPPLAGVTLVLALRGRFARHARLARWTLPAWFYVSVTGVVIYLMLYHLYAPACGRVPRRRASGRRTPARGRRRHTEHRRAEQERHREREGESGKLPGRHRTLEGEAAPEGGEAVGERVEAHHPGERR